MFSDWTKGKADSISVDLSHLQWKQLALIAMQNVVKPGCSLVIPSGNCKVIGEAHESSEESGDEKDDEDKKKEDEEESGSDQD